MNRHSRYFAENLKELGKCKGLSNRQLYGITGIWPETLQKWVRHPSIRIRLSVACQVAKNMGVGLEWFITKGSMTKPYIPISEKNLGRNSKKFCKKRGIDLSELAMEIGVHYNHLSRIRNNRQGTTLFIAYLISEVLKVNLDTLLAEEREA